MVRFSNHNILKLGKSKLEGLSVKKVFSRQRPCPFTCSPCPLHITFYHHTRRQFLDPRRLSLTSSLDSPAIMAEHHKFGREKTLCQDGSLFFECQEDEDNNSRFVAVSRVLDSLNVRRSLHRKIFSSLMAFGRRYNESNVVGDPKKKKKKVLKGLEVKMSFVESFIGDKVSVDEVMEKSWEESKSQDYGEGNLFILAK